ncbi:helix-turn-helix domain-containing protein [Luteococcus japonicus]|uniref:Mobile element protein n=1 Tax=Luteococcus japonicus LSP_Lj1 TaxID=1255658 RepID=A0A1R4K2E5_9ACTN|nr:helix-turn-helix domain-containing protein [Luteococcus japonicus]SJN38203.1 Mobile element protein [Luteococcus japonicus LSP_Lj1]
MANSPAPALGLREGDRERLESLTRSRTAEAGAVMRARIVLAAADGVANDRIAEQLAVSKNTVLTWRRRYAGMAGLADAPRSGRPRQLDMTRLPGSRGSTKR